MPARSPAPGDGAELSRRAFLTRRLPGRVAGPLGGEGAVTPAGTTGESAPPDPPGGYSPCDLTRLSPDEVRAALARIRAQRRGP